MFNDLQLYFSDAQALTGTAASTNVYDFGSDRDVGIGEPLAILLSLDVLAKSSDGNETYSAAVAVDSDSAFGTTATIGTLTITRGDAAGTQYKFTLPADTGTKRYMRMYYTLGGTNPTVTVTAQLLPVSFLQNHGHSAKGYTIS